MQGEARQRLTYWACLGDLTQWRRRLQEAKMDDKAPRRLVQPVASSVVKLRRLGQLLSVEPPCAHVLEPLLRTFVHVGTASAPNGFRSVRVPFELHRVNKRRNDPLVTYASFEPVVRRALLNAGYSVEVPNEFYRCLPEPDRELLQRFNPLDEELIRFVREHDRGLVVFDRRQVGPDRLAAQIALAWPSLKVLIVTARIQDARSLRKQLLRYISLVQVVSGRDHPSQLYRVVVSTVDHMGCRAIDIESADIVIAIDAIEMTSKFAYETLPRALKARVYGFLANNTRPAPFERDLLAGFYGFKQISVPRHGFMPVQVEVARERIQGGMRLGENLDNVALKRRGIWHDDVRNRRIARIARKLDEDGPDTPPAGLSFNCWGEPAWRTIVLVENVEHGLALSRHLAGWHVIAAPFCSSADLNREHQDILLRGQEMRYAKPRNAIYTFSTFLSVDLSDVKVLIRADGGLGLQPLDPGGLVQPACVPQRKLLLVDFDDRHHPRLRQWGRERCGAYAGNGWYPAGIDPVEERVSRFLRTRSQKDRLPPHSSDGQAGARREAWRPV